MEVGGSMTTLRTTESLTERLVFAVFKAALWSIIGLPFVVCWLLTWRSRARAADRFADK